MKTQQKQHTNSQTKDKTDNILTYVDRFDSVRIAVVGDVMLDRFIRGKSTRISPEAPVPVLQYEAESTMLGGAGNVAFNLRQLGVTVALFGSVGKDLYGKEVLKLAKRAGMDTRGLVITEDMTTTHKERIVSNGQHIVRIDQESERKYDIYSTEALTALVARIEKYDAIILSDYDKGVLSDEIITLLISAARTKNVPVIVDTKPSRMFRYKGATLLTPNEKEATEAANRPDPLEAAHFISKKLKTWVLLTRGSKGVSLVRDTKHTSFESNVREVIDVSGAGDTLCAVVAAVLAAGGDKATAAYVGNVAGGIVVGKQGTASVTRSELLAVLATKVPTNLKVHTLESLLDRIRTERADGRNIVLTNGCFDILHRGHVEYLEEAKRQGDFLIVAVNTDESVRSLKGKERPITSLENRMSVLAALASTDAVVPFNEKTANTIVATIKPDVYVKGGNYSREDLLKGEGKVVEKYGGIVYVAPRIRSDSTTDIISKVLMQYAKKYRGSL